MLQCQSQQPVTDNTVCCTVCLRLGTRNLISYNNTKLNRFAPVSQPYVCLRSMTLLCQSQTPLLNDGIRFDYGCVRCINRTFAYAACMASLCRRRLPATGSCCCAVKWSHRDWGSRWSACCGGVDGLPSECLSGGLVIGWPDTGSLYRALYSPVGLPQRPKVLDCRCIMHGAHCCLTRQCCRSTITVLLYST
jgi:hypothetical protein